ncbi:hypothetical protein OJ996_21950 [Luteolibacter sp. GHJ8]|uniref:DUF551 domain-containing protein n=1 Tax=Luteolibacter rhizosphaerae TaxID=2989719 RepID=A0ABT3G8U4_9BACT|nr:hypothetical protein [Luteolibacter rhizosphaerae]MCW1916268.1 hypothetical protein [Luteolibacter rhizosphaerae]
MNVEIATCPTRGGWYWWRQHEFDTWKVVEVRSDHGALYCATDDDMDYQSGDDPEAPFTGDWWAMRIEPPPDPAAG